MYLFYINKVRQYLTVFLNLATCSLDLYLFEKCFISGDRISSLSLSYGTTLWLLSSVLGDLER